MGFDLDSFRINTVSIIIYLYCLLAKGTPSKLRRPASRKGGGEGAGANANEGEGRTSRQQTTGARLQRQQQLRQLQQQYLYAQGQPRYVLDENWTDDDDHSFRQGNNN
jgi:hypothetical protein